MIPKILCVPGRLADGSDAEWFLTVDSENISVSIGTGSRCPMVPGHWRRLAANPSRWAETAREISRENAAYADSPRTLRYGPDGNRAIPWRVQSAIVLAKERWGSGWGYLSAHQRNSAIAYEILVMVAETDDGNRLVADALAYMKDAHS